MVRPQRSDAARNRELIVSAAVALFRKEGLQVPTEDIARAAGVGKATLYRNFPQREDLVGATLSESIDELQRLHERLIDDTDPDAALRAWLRALIAFSSTYRGLPGQVLDAASPSTFRETCDALEAHTIAQTARVKSIGASGRLNGTDLYLLANAAAWTVELSNDLDRAYAYLDVLLEGATK